MGGGSGAAAAGSGIGRASNGGGDDGAAVRERKCARWRKTPAVDISGPIGR